MDSLRGGGRDPLERERDLLGERGVAGGKERTPYPLSNSSPIPAPCRAQSEDREHRLHGDEGLRP